MANQKIFNTIQVFCSIFESTYYKYHEENFTFFFYFIYCIPGY
jgi:hypothetical protein